MLIECPDAVLEGTLIIPEDAESIVLFAHGSGSSRHSPRNHYVARELRQAGFGTLLFDLLTYSEDADRSKVFDIPLLANRLLGTIEWMAGQPSTAGLGIGLFGASTGAAAALMAAAREPAAIQAVVSRGGRPDLAEHWLPKVEAPTLLIVGEQDFEVIKLNRGALMQLNCTKRLAIVPRATHLFSEPGTLEKAAGLACEWFTEHFGGR